MFFFLFSVDLRSVSDLGFGTIFDGTSGGSGLENVSTQAVMEMMKNIKVPEVDPIASFIQMDQNDIESFCIPRTDANLTDLSNALGELLIVFEINVVYMICHFFVLDA